MMSARNSALQSNLKRVRGEIAKAAERSDRTGDDVLLVAVTKGFPASDIAALIELGCLDFGESKVQELREKQAQFPPIVQWHQIGHLQSNKAKFIAPYIRMVHSLDSLGTAIELSSRAAENGRIIDVLIEVNISGEVQKHGARPAEAEKLLTDIESTCGNLRVRGLMGIASERTAIEAARPQFSFLRELLNRMNPNSRNPAMLSELSMGMSHDFTVAIEEGATIVRVGSSLLGNRTY